MYRFYGWVAKSRQVEFLGGDHDRVFLAWPPDGGLRVYEDSDCSERPVPGCRYPESPRALYVVASQWHRAPARAVSLLSNDCLKGEATSRRTDSSFSVPASEERLQPVCERARYPLRRVLVAGPPSGGWSLGF